MTYFLMRCLTYDMAQKSNQEEEIRNTIKEFIISSSKEELKRIPQEVFKNIIKRSYEEAAIKYLKKFKGRGQRE